MNLDGHTGPCVFSERPVRCGYAFRYRILERKPRFFFDRSRVFARLDVYKRQGKINPELGVGLLAAEGGAFVLSRIFKGNTK